MCTGLELAAIAGGTSAAVGVANSVESSRKAKHAAQDAERERRDSEAQAAQRASAKMQAQRAALRRSSLYTGAGEAGGQTLGVG